VNVGGQRLVRVGDEEDARGPQRCGACEVSKLPPWLGGPDLLGPGGPLEEGQDRDGVVVEHLCASELAVAHLVETQDG
jgi:hypothetical protein